MKKVVLVVLLLAIGVGVAGCPGDAEHNAKHLYIWKRDLQHIHREWDAIWLEDQPTRLTPFRDY